MTNPFKEDREIQKAIKETDPTTYWLSRGVMVGFWTCIAPLVLIGVGVLLYVIF